MERPQEDLAAEVNGRTKLFIRRERLRRRLIQIRFGETICLQSDEVETLLKWIKELERTVEEWEREKSKGRLQRRG